MPYELAFETRTTRVEPMSVIEGRAPGELEGVGRWTLQPPGMGTRVQYDWNVEVTKPWMRVFAPILRPVFARSHNVIISWGEEDIRARLAVAD